jgi:hypothetical protein
MTNARANSTATLLPDGQVLISGGFDGASALSSCELYNPINGSWTTTGSLLRSRYNHTATLLPNGKVLVTGGRLSSTELYDPATGTWSTTGSFGQAIFENTAILLPNGKVLVAGGFIDNLPWQGTQLYDAARGTWTTGVPLLAAHGALHTATLLPRGEVLLVGGEDQNGNPIANAELYNVGLNFDDTLQPKIQTAMIRGGGRFQLTGSEFQGTSQASGGSYQDSSTNYPIVRLRSIGNEQVTYLLVDPARGWSDTSFSSLALAGFPAGPTLITVIVNGIPSTSKYFAIPTQ